MVQIVILAGVALFLVLQLRKVLGTRDGYEPPKDLSAPVEGPSRKNPRDFEVIDGGGIDYDIADQIDVESASGMALAAMKRSDPSFNVTEFIGGARGAYEMILMAFESGEIADVRDFLSSDVYDSFAQAIAVREENGLHIDATFVGIREVKLREADFDPETSEGSVTIAFTGELTSVVKNAEGNIVEGDPNEIKKQRDVWTFARRMGTDDPNWTLVATE